MATPSGDPTWLFLGLSVAMALKWRLNSDLLMPLENPLSPWRSCSDLLCPSGENALFLPICETFFTQVLHFNSIASGT